jgi:Abnormal spindle-like microcephaly-assoc'd, ASPM-SPD-2-Hydin
MSPVVRRLLLLALSSLALVALPAADALAAPDLTFAPADPVAYPDTTIGTSNTADVQLDNLSDGTVDIAGVALGGADADQFAIDQSSCPPSLDPGQSCTVTVGFHPLRAGVSVAQLVVSHDGATQPLARELDGLALAPQLSAQPSSQDFGLTPVNQGEQDTWISVRNDGGASASVGAASIDGAGSGAYHVSSDGCQGQLLAPGSTCAVQVGFDPSDGVAYAATLHVPSGGADLAVPLAGVGGVQSALLTPAALDFGAISVGDSLTQTVALRNTGNLPFQAIVVLPTGGDVGAFGVVADSCAMRQIAPGDSCALKVRFAPQAAGVADATLTVIRGDGEPLQLALHGDGRQANAVVVPGRVDFAGQPLGGASDARTITLVNSGDAPLRVASASLGGGDAEAFRIAGEDCTAAPVAPAAACTVRVRFVPGAPGSASATLRFVTNDADGVATADLAGRGTPAATATIVRPRADVAFDWRRGTPAPYDHGRIDLGTARCVRAVRCVVSVRARVFGAATSALGVSVRSVGRVRWLPGGGTAVALPVPPGLRGAPVLLVAQLRTRAAGRRPGVRTIVVPLLAGTRRGSVILASR